MSPNEPAPRQHAHTGPKLPQLPEPTHAERVRTLLSLVSIATLSRYPASIQDFCLVL
jgi:hypothetical protein